MIALLSIPPAAWLFAKCLFTTLITRLGCVWWAAVHLLLRWVYLNVSPVFFSTLFSTLTTQGLLTPYSLRQHFCVQMGIPVSQLIWHWFWLPVFVVIKGLCNKHLIVLSGSPSYKAGAVPSVDASGQTVPLPFPDNNQGFFFLQGERLLLILGKERKPDVPTPMLQAQVRTFAAMTSDTRMAALFSQQYRRFIFSSNQLHC